MKMRLRNASHFRAALRFFAGEKWFPENRSVEKRPPKGRRGPLNAPKASGQMIYHAGIMKLFKFKFSTEFTAGRQLSLMELSFR